MSRKSLFAAFFLLCCAFLCPCLPLHAQVENGINGTVADLSGAVVAGAHVTATNIATGVTSSAVTSSAGTFTVVGLSPGEYSLIVEAAGFKTTKTMLTVEVAKISTANFQLSPGATSETVSVTDTAALLNTTSPTVGTTLEPDAGEGCTDRDQRPGAAN